MADSNKFPFDLVIFDCDGVLVDSEPIYNSMLMEMFAQAGLVLSYEEVVANCVGKSLKSIVAFAEDRLGKTGAIDFTDLETKTREAFKIKLKPVAGIVETLAEIEQKICVASSSSHERINFLLGITNLSSHFGDKIFSATEVARGKPNPDLFLHAAQKMNCSPARTAVIEDSLAGVEAGVAAGMTVFAYAGTFSEDQLLAVKAHMAFTEMKLLPSLLQLHSLNFTP